MPLPTKFYTPDQVAKRFKVSRRAVYLWIKQGRLKAYRLASTVRIAEGDLEAFIETPEKAESKPPEPRATKKARKARRTARKGN